MNRTTYRREHLAVTVIAPVPDYLDQLLEPYIVPGQSSVPGWTVDATGKLDPPDEPAVHIVQDGEAEPSRRLWISPGSRLVSVAPCDEPWRRLFTLRTVRNLFRWQLGPEASFLHGGLIVWGGVGIAVAGGKRSGKTSSIIAALAGGFDFVTNDDLLLLPGPGGTVRGLGWPRSVGIRTDTLLMIPPVAEPTASHPVNESLFRQGQTLSGEKVTHLYLTPGELAAAYGRSVLSEHSISAVLFPCFTPDSGPGLYRLGPDEARAMLIDCSPQQPDHHDTFWDPHIPQPGSQQRLSRLLQTAGHLPCYRLCQPFDRLSQGARLIQELCRSQRQEAAI